MKVVMPVSCYYLMFGPMFKLPNAYLNEWMAAWWIHACALRIIKSIIFSDFGVMLIDLPTPSHPLILYKTSKQSF